MKKYILAVCMLTTLLVACQNDRDQMEPEYESMEEGQSIEVNKEAKEAVELKVNLVDREGVEIGYATLKEEADGVHIHLTAHQLPEGLHGFHIHEKGICEPPSFESAGGHFNPDGKNHGFDDPQGPHAGDMENIEVLADGTVDVKVINDRVTLKRGEVNSLLQDEGTSLMIHRNPDDYITQPAGNAGDRIACGVISPEKSTDKKD